jgi:tripeptide aminopeptidase
MQNRIQKFASRPEIKRLLDRWPTNRETVLAEALAIQAIPAPTFDEQARAVYLQSAFREIGLRDVVLDEVGNVSARMPGRQTGQPGVLVSAHMDTVFPAGTDLTPEHDLENRRVCAPGLGDNSLGVAAMLALARQLIRADYTPSTDIWWLGTVCEEGLGDLRGMRHAYDRLHDQLGAAIILEGIGLGLIYHAGLGVRRLRVAISGPGGHSWLHRGRPSAIHHLLRLGNALLDHIEVPKQSSFNIGLIAGGTSINTLAPDASLSIDLRSTNPDTLAALEAGVQAVVEPFRDAPDLDISIRVIGNRPSATLPAHHPLVTTSQGILGYLSVGSSTEIGSTDANILLAGGIPSVCIGITQGGNAHTTDEYVDPADIPTGMQQLTLLALLVAENIAGWSAWDAGD